MQALLELAVFASFAIQVVLACGGFFCNNQIPINQVVMLQ